MLKAFDILFFLIILTVIYVISFLGYRKSLHKGKLAQNDLVNYLIKRFSLPKDDLDYGEMIVSISLINAFIMALVTTVIIKINLGYLWQFLIGFVLIFFLIYSLYELYGRYLSKKTERRKKK